MKNRSLDNIHYCIKYNFKNLSNSHKIRGMLSILFLRARMTLGGFIPFSVRSAIESKSLTAFKFRENLKAFITMWCRKIIGLNGLTTTLTMKKNGTK